MMVFSDIASRIEAAVQASLSLWPKQICSFAPEVQQNQAQVLQLWLFIQMLRRLIDVWG